MKIQIRCILYRRIGSIVVIIIITITLILLLLQPYSNLQRRCRDTLRRLLSDKRVTDVVKTAIWTVKSTLWSFGARCAYENVVALDGRQSVTAQTERTWQTQTVCSTFEKRRLGMRGRPMLMFESARQRGFYRVTR